MCAVSFRCTEGKKLKSNKKKRRVKLKNPQCFEISSVLKVMRIGCARPSVPLTNKIGWPSSAEIAELIGGCAEAS